MIDQHPRFLSIIAPPQGWPIEKTAAELARLGVMDLETLRLRLSLTPPLVLGRVPCDIARLAIDTLARAGGDAFAPTMPEVESLGPTMKIRDLRIEPGRLEADLWRGGSAFIPLDAIRVIVRGVLSRTRNTTTVEPRIRVTRVAVLAGGVAGIGAPVNNETVRETRTDLSYRIDLHTADRRVFQVDGDKFAFAVLEGRRGHSDLENTQTLVRMLQHLAPHAVMDDFFRLWRPPAEIRQLRLPMMKINNDDPAFAFYSRWVALMYRHMGV